MKSIKDFLKITLGDGVLVVLPLLLFYMLLSEILGLALRSSLLRRLGLWIENAILGQLPIYKAVKSLSRGLVGAKEDGVFKPAILTSSDGSKAIDYQIEDHDDGQVTILVP